jgi:hypothetical protein
MGQISAKNREVAPSYGCAVGIEKIHAARSATCAIFSRLSLQMPGLSPGRQCFRLNKGLPTLSILFSTKDRLTVAQLVGAWGPELGRLVPDPSRVEADLVHELLEDIINGRFDNSGPLCEGQRLGLRLITPKFGAGFLVGHEVRGLMALLNLEWVKRRVGLWRRG